MPKLFVRLLSPAEPADEGYQIASAWMIQEDDGRIRARGEADFRGLSELVDPDTDWIRSPANVVVIVPAEHVLSLSVEVPGRSVGQIRRALPFVVEEYVTTEIESMHLASGELERGAASRVNLIERSVLDDWLACLAELGIRPGYLFSEAELLPCNDSEATLLLDDDRVLVRTRAQAAAVDRENFTLAAGALDVDRLVVVYGTLSELEHGELRAEFDVETSDVPETGTVLEYLAAQWRTTDAVNLLQGEYRPRQPASPVWQRWRVAASLAAVWVVVALASMTAQAIYADYRADELEARSEALYRDIFPGERRVNNPRRQLQTKLGERTDGGGAGLLSYLAPLATNLGPGSRVASFSYDDDRGELAVDLFTDGFDSLDRIKESLAGEGVNVEITSAEQLDNGVRARIRLGAPS